VRPILFHFGPITVHSWGLMFMLGIFAAILVGRWYLKRHDADPNKIYGLTAAAVVGGLVGARLFYVIGNWNQYASNPWQVLKFWDLSGLVFYGGLLGGTLAAVVFIRLKRLPFWTFADMAGLAVPLGMAITRVGCFLNGDSFGKASGLPWAVTFPQQTRIDMGITALRVHPVQLYELILDLGLFTFLMFYQRRERQDGNIFLLFLVGYSLIRFCMEFLRFHAKADAGPVFQIMSVVIFVAAGIVIFMRSKTAVPQPD
jgi:phosphatidylglycerol---prolipoprotein diacylglyceryl transferase